MILEVFIKKYRHLPDISSQKEVEKGGIDIGDNQALLLKKIEELTLYIINQNRKLVKLESNQMKLQVKNKKIEKEFEMFKTRNMK